MTFPEALAGAGFRLEPRHEPRPENPDTWQLADGSLRAFHYWGDTERVDVWRQEPPEPPGPTEQWRLVASVYEPGLLRRVVSEGAQ